MMSPTLASSYPTGEHLEGNFVTYYTTNYELFDRYVVKLFGERAIEVDDTEPLSDTVINWTYDVDGIVFSHLVDWAKMYSASIKDYEPLWNVDGTVTTTYGATRDTDSFGNKREQNAYGATSNSMQYGATSESTQYGATSETTQYGARSETTGARSDEHNDYKTSYPDSTEVKTDRSTDSIGTQTNTKATVSDTVSGTTHTDTHTGTTHTDTATGTAHTDTFTEDAHSDTHTSDQHIDTERRTGNIGVTKSTELIESEYRLRDRWNFYKLIFGYIVREMGCIYYDWY